MTIVAGVGRAELYRQVGPRDAETVIVPLIDDHVGAGRHVARRTGKWRVQAFVTVMSRHGVFVRRVTLQAHAIAGRTQLRGMRLVTIAARDPRGEHPALLE